MKRKDRTAEKAAADPQSGSAGTAPLRRAFRFGFPRCSCYIFAACAWLRRAKRAALVIDKHTPQCQLNKFCGLKQNDNYLKNFNYSL